MFFYFYYGFLPCNKRSSTSMVTSILVALSCLLHRRNFTSKFSLSLSEKSDDKCLFANSVSTSLGFFNLSLSLIMQPLSKVQEYSSTILLSCSKLKFYPSFLVILWKELCDLKDEVWSRLAVKIAIFFFSKPSLVANMKNYLLRHNKLLFLDFCWMDIS